MEVKQNIQKAVEDGGFVDLRRIQKANSQLEYQPNLSQFMGGKNGFEMSKEPFESQEYKDILKKQRDADYKSDMLVNSSMSIFKQYTEIPETVEAKVKRLRQNNKNEKEYQRNQMNSTDLIPVESELKKKQFIFPAQRKPETEGEFQKINTRSMMRDDSDSQSTSTTVERSQRGGSIIQSRGNNNNSSISTSSSQKMTNSSDQQLQGQASTPSDQQNKVKFDFYQINSKVQLKKRENVINKQIGNLPRDIQAISDIQDEITDENQGVNNFSTEDPFDRRYVDCVQGDLAEAFSIAYVFPKNSVQKATHNLFFYRDLAPISRFLMKFSNLSIKEQQFQTQKFTQGINDMDNNFNSPNQSFNNNTSTNFFDLTSNAELIQEDEISFNIRELSYSNISDVISGRISEEQLAKLDNNILSIEELPPKVQQKVQELIKQSVDIQMKSLPILAQNSSSRLSQFSDQEETTKNPKKSALNVNKLNINTQEKSKSQAVQKEQPKNIQPPKQRQDQSAQVDETLQNNANQGNQSGRVSSQTDLSPEQRKAQAELLQIHGQTDQILNRIAEIKSQKDNLKFIKDPQELLAYYKDLRKELQGCLTGLLFMILKTEQNPNPTVMNKNSDIEYQVSQLLQNLDKIQGTKTSDGHLKVELLLTFLEEYKWIKTEDQLNKLDLENTNKQNNQNNNNTEIGNQKNKVNRNSISIQGNNYTVGNGNNLLTPSSKPGFQQYQQPSAQGVQPNNPSKFMSKSPNQRSSKENIIGSGNIPENNSRANGLQKNIKSNGNSSMLSTRNDAQSNTQSFSRNQRSVSPNISSGSWNMQRLNTTISHTESTPQKGHGRNLVLTSSSKHHLRMSLSPISSKNNQNVSSQQSSSRHNNASSNSSLLISPISASRKELGIYETKKKNLLQTTNIPGIKRGQNSLINQAYLLESSMGFTRSPLSSIGTPKRK